MGRPTYCAVSRTVLISVAIRSVLHSLREASLQTDLLDRPHRVADFAVVSPVDGLNLNKCNAEKSSYRKRAQIYKEKK